MARDVTSQLPQVPKIGTGSLCAATYTWCSRIAPFRYRGDTADTGQNIKVSRPGNVRVGIDSFIFDDLFGSTAEVDKCVCFHEVKVSGKDEGEKRFSEIIPLDKILDIASSDLLVRGTDL